MEEHVLSGTVKFFALGAKGTDIPGKQEHGFDWRAEHGVQVIFVSDCRNDLVWVGWSLIGRIFCHGVFLTLVCIGFIVLYVCLNHLAREQAGEVVVFDLKREVRSIGL